MDYPIFIAGTPSDARFKVVEKFFNMQNINQALPKELPLFCGVRGVANKSSENNSKAGG